jgi:serine/threonine-protein kinase
LGAILYELLTGRPPYRGETMLETIQMTERGDPPPPHRLNPSVDCGLEDICIKCMEREPRHRYATADELADDLAVWQEGRKPPPARWPAKVKRFTRRNRLACATAAAILCIAAVLPFWLEFRSPERQYKKMLFDLRTGRPVLLLGETGQPPHQVWILPDAHEEIRAASDGAFCIDSGNMGLLELLHDPQCSRYRVRLEIRHDQNPSSYSQVGIYFGYTVADVNGTEEHRYWRLVFNALWDRNRTRKVDDPAGNVLDVWVNRVMPTKAPGHDVRIPPEQVYFPMPAPGAWNNVTLTVTPEKIEFQMGDRTAQLTAEQLTEATSPWDVSPRPIAFDLNPRGGLGLFVWRGTASFRNITVEPLPDSP